MCPDTATHECGRAGKPKACGGHPLRAAWFGGLGLHPQSVAGAESEQPEALARLWSLVAGSRGVVPPVPSQLTTGANARILVRSKPLSSCSLLVPLLAVAIAPAQCPLTYVPGVGLPATGQALVRGVTMWDPDGSGPQSERLVVAGIFTLPAPIGATNIAALDLATGTWSAIPGSPVAGDARALVTMANGDLVVSHESGTGVTISRYDGTSWSTLTTTNGHVITMLAATNGDLYVGGSFTAVANTLILSLARFNGTSWSPLGTGLSAFSYVTSIAELPNGSLVVGGNFSSAGGVTTPGIANWNGTSWSAIGSGFGGLTGIIAVGSDGNIYASGSFASYAAGIGQFDGASWSIVPGSLPFAGALTVLPDGDLVAARLDQRGRFSAGTWTGFAGALAVSDPARSPRVEGFEMLPNGDLAVYGEFDTAAGLPSPGFALLRSSCPPSISPAGAGCPSVGGANLFTATNLPWLGATFRGRGEGLPPLAVVSIVTGLSPTQLPMSAVLPQGVPGCDLLVTPDFFELAITTTGTVTTAVRIPPIGSLLGIDFWQQLNPVEVSPPYNIVALTASNALRMRIGDF